MVIYPAYMSTAPLIRSPAAGKLLALLTSLPGEELHTNELIRRTGVNARAAQRALERLELAAVLQSRRVGTLRLWRIERAHPLLPALRELSGRTYGVPSRVSAVLAKDAGVSVAFLFGSYAEGKDTPTSDVDLFVVGSPDQRRLQHVLDRLERELGREINVVTWSERDLRQPSPVQEAFLHTISAARKIWLKGDERELERRRSGVGEAGRTGRARRAERTGGSSARDARAAQRASRPRVPATRRRRPSAHQR